MEVIRRSTISSARRLLLWMHKVSVSLEASVELLFVTEKDVFCSRKSLKENTYPIFQFDPKAYDSKSDYEKEITNAHCHKHQVEFIVLAGYMRLIGDTLLQKVTNRIINIHPSLLHPFLENNAVRQALQAGLR